MESKIMFAIIFCCSSLAIAAAICRQDQDPIIFNLGDSNSDTGGYTAAYGVNFGFPNGRRFFHRSSDRFCDGRLIIDFLCETVKAELLSSYMESLTPSFKNGVNFAVGGATAVKTSNFFSLKTQLLQFLRYRSRSLNFHSEGIKGMFGQEDFENALYMLDVGQNDISGAFLNHTKPQVMAQIPSYISGIKEAMEGIYNVGGRNFWVHNTGPVGCLPRFLATMSIKVGGEFDQTGCLKSMNEAAQEFNARLRDLCDQLRIQLKNATVVYVDMYTIKHDLISNFALYGFENPLMACCGGGGAPYNANILCAANGSTVCDEGSRFVSWDGIHYTDDSNAVFAARIASTNYSTPPIKFESFWSC